MAGQEQADLVLARRQSLAIAFQDKNTIQFFKQLVRRESVQVLQHAVIRQDLHLVMGKDHA